MSATFSGGGFPGRGQMPGRGLRVDAHLCRRPRRLFSIYATSYQALGADSTTMDVGMQMRSRDYNTADRESAS